MMELIQVTEKAWYFDCPAKVGLVQMNDREVCLIDSGSSKEAAKKVLKTVQAHGWTIHTILNTHSHADHIGGNAYLSAQTGCRILASGLECAYTVFPQLEPMTLYGGKPPKALCHKFLMAQPSPADLLTEENVPEGIRILPLPGHAPDMVGFATDDGAVFLADCLSSPETLDKYGIPFLIDPAKSRETLRKVREMKGHFIPSHAQVTEEIVPLVDRNLEQMDRIEEEILKRCKVPISFENLLAGLFEAFSLKMTPEQHALVGSTVRSFLAQLWDADRIQVDFENCIMHFSVKK